jgi:hypothetical protein
MNYAQTQYASRFREWVNHGLDTNIATDVSELQPKSGLEEDRIYFVTLHD